MKNNTLFFLIFCLCFTEITFAQQSNVTLPTNTNQTQSSAFELINLTGDSSILGYLKINPESNERETVITPTDKQQWLQNAVAVNLEGLSAAQSPAKPSRFYHEGASVLFILHDISVGRTITGNYTRLKAVVYAGDSKGYVLTRQVDTLVTDEAEDISSVGGLIAKAVTATGQVVLPAHNMPGLATEPEATLTRDEVIQAEKDRYAFVRRSCNPTDIYMSYEEFKNGKPAFEHFYLKGEDESSSLTVHSFTEADSTLRPIVKYFVFL